MQKNEIYDVTFKCSFNCVMKGSSGSGKNTGGISVGKHLDVQMLSSDY